MTLGVVTVLVVLQNWMALSASLPRDVSSTWLGRFTVGSFLFNVFAFGEQVLVNFGLQAHKWLETQRAFVASVQRWDLALFKHSSALVDLFHEWDIDGDGEITKKEFYKGVTKLIPAAPINEARDARVHCIARCIMVCAAHLCCALCALIPTLTLALVTASLSLYLSQNPEPDLSPTPSPNPNPHPRRRSTASSTCTIRTAMAR